MPLSTQPALPAAKNRQVLQSPLSLLTYGHAHKDIYYACFLFVSLKTKWYFMKSYTRSTPPSLQRATIILGYRWMSTDAYIVTGNINSKRGALDSDELEKLFFAVIRGFYSHSCSLACLSTQLLAAY